MSDQPYQLLPPLTAEEYAALREDIAANGIRVPVDVDEHGQVLDGHHRQSIAAELGIPCPTRVVAGLTEDDKRAHALAVNVQRRILTREQRRALIAQQIQRDPSLSDRAVGRLLGCDHKTVAAVRRELSGEIPHHRLERVLQDQDYAPFTPHPLLATLPLVPVDQFAEIVTSVRRMGLLMPIVVNHDRTVLVDGRIRYLACRAAHVEPTYRVLGDYFDDEKTLGWIISANIMRKGLNPLERALLVGAVEEYRATQEVFAPGPRAGGGA